MERSIRRIAEKHCGGRHVLALEGGYNQHTLPWLVTGIVAAMGVFPFGRIDPFAPEDTTTLPPEHERRISDVVDTLRPYWRLD